MNQRAIIFIMLAIGTFLDRVYTENITRSESFSSSKRPNTTDVSSTPWKLRAPEVTILVNINTADAEELQTLPTIGPKRARAILKYRAQLPDKRFMSVEELQNVSGISTKSFQGLRAYIILS